MGTIEAKNVQDSTAPAGKLTEARRIWLDPYKVRSSILLERRDESNLDSANSGLVAVAVESLASSSASDDPKTTYRKGVLLEGSGPNGIQAPGDSLFALNARSDTPGYAADPTWNAPTVNLSITASTSSSTSVDVTIDTYGPKRGHLRYDKAGLTDVNGEDSDLLGYPIIGSDYGGEFTGAAESATEYYNSTTFNQIDGFELYLEGEAIVTTSFYESIVDGQPYNLLGREEFNLVGEGWTRAFLNVPVRFEPTSSIVFSTDIRRTDGGEEAFFYRYLPWLSLKQRNTLKSYQRPNQNYSFFDAPEQAFGHILLLSE